MGQHGDRSAQFMISHCAAWNPSLGRHGERQQYALQLPQPGMLCTFAAAYTKDAHSNQGPGQQVWGACICPYPHAHKLADVLCCHTPQGSHGVLLSSALAAACAACCCCRRCWLAVRVRRVPGDALLCVHVHIVPPSERSWQLVDAALVDGRRLQDRATDIRRTAQEQVQQQLASEEQAVQINSVLRRHLSLQFSLLSCS
jgi:hypothetical protein